MQSDAEEFPSRLLEFLCQVGVNQPAQLTQISFVWQHQAALYGPFVMKYECHKQQPSQW